MNIIVANFFALLALIDSIYLYQAINKKELFKRQVIYTFFMSLEFIFLNKIIALRVIIISFLRALIFYIYEKNNRSVPYIYIIFIIFLFLLNIKLNMNIIPPIIGIIYTLSLQLKNVNKIKIICLILLFVWIIYYFYIKAYISIIMALINVFSIIYALKKDSKNL